LVGPMVILHRSNSDGVEGHRPNWREQPRNKRKTRNRQNTDEHGFFARLWSVFHPCSFRGSSNRQENCGQENCPEPRVGSRDKCVIFPCQYSCQSLRLREDSFVSKGGLPCGRCR